MGGASKQIHSRMFKSKPFWEYLGSEGGKENRTDGKFIRETFDRTGALEMGNGIWRVFYRNVFLGCFNENELRTKEQSVRLETNLV